MAPTTKPAVPTAPTSTSRLPLATSANQDATPNTQRWKHGVNASTLYGRRIPCAADHARSRELDNAATTRRPYCRRRQQRDNDAGTRTYSRGGLDNNSSSREGVEDASNGAYLRKNVGECGTASPYTHYSRRYSLVDDRAAVRSAPSRGISSSYGQVACNTRQPGDMETRVSNAVPSREMGNDGAQRSARVSVNAAPIRGSACPQSQSAPTSSAYPFHLPTTTTNTSERADVVRARTGILAASQYRARPRRIAHHGRGRRVQALWVAVSNITATETHLLRIPDEQRAICGGNIALVRCVFDAEGHALTSSRGYERLRAVVDVRCDGLATEGMKARTASLLPRDMAPKLADPVAQGHGANVSCIIGDDEGAVKRYEWLRALKLEGLSAEEDYILVRCLLPDGMSYLYAPWNAMPFAGGYVADARRTVVMDEWRRAALTRF
ncbi:hypothetical protein BJ912DRAFT_1144867 [Pholiota molesta]|nr:hypothetical protein BJ912DRAFT_1144867 [Pholiota molesta]